MYKEIDVAALAGWRRSGHSFVLLDVRDPDELAIASIPGAVTIPMNEIPARLDELDRSTTIAVMCQHGGRSARVAQFLSGQGFSDIYNVDGGIDAYAKDIDPTIPRY